MTLAFDLLLSGDVFGALKSSWTITAVGEWIYLIVGLTLEFGLYLRHDRNIEIPAVFGIIIATPFLALTPVYGLAGARVGFILLVISIASLLYFFAIGRET